jgi:hypothetical protein
MIESRIGYVSPLCLYLSRTRSSAAFLRRSIQKDACGTASTGRSNSSGEVANVSRCKVFSMASFCSLVFHRFFRFFSSNTLPHGKTKQVAAGLPAPPPKAEGFPSLSSLKAAASNSSSSPPAFLPSRLLGIKTPLQDRVDAAIALAEALQQTSPSPSSSSSYPSYVAAAKHDAVSASVAAADAVALLAWGGKSEALGAAADAGDTAVSAVDDLLLKTKKGLSGGIKNTSSTSVSAGPLRSAEAIERAAVGAIESKAVSTLDAAVGALINKTRGSWSTRARPWLSRTAEALSNATGGKTLPVDAEGRLEVGVGSALVAADSKRAGLRAAADAEIAEKLAGGSKLIGEMGILVSLELGNDPLDPGVGSSSSSLSSSSSSVPSLENAASASAAPVSSRVLSSDRWDPSLLTNTGGPDFSFDPQLVSARAISDAFEALVRSRLAADGVSGLARRLASAAVALDPQRGLFEVRLAWRSGGSGSALASAIAAVNDADPRDPCRSWAEHFDVCSAIQQSSVLNVAGVRARADTAPPGAHAAWLHLGRRSGGRALPSTVGSPQVVIYEVPDGGGGRAGGQGQNPLQAVVWNDGRLKDLYWYIDKSIEGSANIANAIKDWKGIGNDGNAAQRVASDLTKKWAAGLNGFMGVARVALGLVGGIIFLSQVAAIFLPPQPDPIIMASLNTITHITNETLTRVKEIQKKLDGISQSLNEISGQISTLSCVSKADQLIKPINDLTGLYREYYGPLEKPDPQIRGYFDELIDYALSQSQPPQSLIHEIDVWSAKVRDSTSGVMASLNNIYSTMVGDLIAENSFFTRCGPHYLNKVAVSKPMPIDDTILYNGISEVVAVSRLVFSLRSLSSLRVILLRHEEPRCHLITTRFSSSSPSLRHCYRKYSGGMPEASRCWRKPVTGQR